jgi:hypothetical protein
LFIEKRKLISRLYADFPGQPYGNLILLQLPDTLIIKAFCILAELKSLVNCFDVQSICKIPPNFYILDKFRSVFILSTSFSIDSAGNFLKKNGSVRKAKPF